MLWLLRLYPTCVHPVIYIIYVNTVIYEAKPPPTLLQPLSV